MAELLTRRAVAAAVLASVLTACPGSPAPSPTPAGSRVPSGGSVTLAYPSEPATLDPLAPAGFGTATRDLLALMMPSLYRAEPAGKRTPWLLSREPVVPGASPTEITLDLREDAVWSDGMPITVRDLRFTWRRAMTREGLWSRDPYDRIESVKQLSPKRALVTFTQPFARWREIFDEVLPAHALRTAARRRALGKRWPVSGGPFVLTRWRQGLDMRFERNERAWPRAPQLDAIRVVFVPDGTGALALLKRGKVDMLGPYLAPDWQRRASAFDVARDRGGTDVSIVFNTRAGPLRSRRVRQAVGLAIDRRRVVATLLQAGGARIDALRGTTGAPFDPDGDLERAGDLLDADGWRGKPQRTKRGADLSFTLAFAGDDDLSGPIIRAIERQVGRAGIAVETVALERRDLEAEWLAGDLFDAALLVTRGRAARTWVGRGSMTRLRDRRLEDALATVDRGTPGEPAARRLRTLAPVIPLFAPDVVLVSTDVEQVRASSSMPFWNAVDWKRAE